ncbi:MAG: alpha/beta fold hydrolase [Inquilinus sp.]|nr:alpha/beta fold hydrolase [Inquilinus sp.]
MTEPRQLPLPRQGPRPLAVHLATAQAMWLSSLAALPLLRSDSPSWKPSGPLGDLLPALSATSPEQLGGAVDRAVRERADAFLTGLERYRHHPYRRDIEDPPALWREGDTRLLDYGATAPGAPGAGSGRPVLFVPSLVNRGYVLDLSSRTSLLRWLAGHGFRPLLVDWGWPGAVERRYDMTDYVAGRQERALDAAVAAAGGPMPVVGYCMGGLFVAALARRRPREVSAAVFMATPWDFHAADLPTVERLVASMTPVLPLVREWGELPVDGIQSLFAGLDPMLAVNKFSRFARLDPDSDKARGFVALEDWLNDGVPLVGQVAEECIAGWYGANTPARKQWYIAGEPVDPAAIGQPTLHLIPQTDRIVPPASAEALAAAIPNARRIVPPLGHIGMVVGGRAPQLLWQVLADWLEDVK